MAYSLSTQWLRGVRLGIPRIERYRAAAPSNLLASGEGVARFLYHWQRWGRSDRVRDAVELVLAFYRRLGFRLETTEVAPLFFRLDVAADGQVTPVNLIDTGEGLTQVLAPLIALARAATGIGPRLVALEQPELHLHTDAQVELATSLIDAVNKGAQVTIETHSEVLFAAIQLALARRELQPNMVKLYWVARRPDGASVARPVTLDERGHVDGLWPMDAFDDLLKLKSALYRAYRGGE
ncbi:MAG: AAA family ATPase [Deltaproteobacteria bacterium]|nr:AAA family ATPase [Deltaproteobacteria bacterium]